MYIHYATWYIYLKIGVAANILSWFLMSKFDYILVDLLKVPLKIENFMLKRKKYENWYIQGQE